MAEAIIKRLCVDELLPPSEIRVTEPIAPRREYLSQTYDVACFEPGEDGAIDAESIVLAVKPQVLDRVLPGLKGKIAPEAIVLSIMAGVRISTLRRGLAHESIVRSMPNTPAQVGQGMTVWTATSAVDARGRMRAQTILEAMGDALYVDDEKALDMATGLSGSGPGFVFLIIEAMADAGVQIGLSREQSLRMVLQTIDGSVQLARESGLHPAELRNRVTSPAGTTAAGLFALEQAGIRGTLTEAIEQAYLRSKELGDQSEDD